MYPLYLFGECHTQGVPDVRPKGLEKIAADFEPNYKYVNMNEIVKTPAPNRKNLHSLTKIMKSDLFGQVETTQALDTLLLDQPEPTPYSL